MCGSPCRGTGGRTTSGRVPTGSPTCGIGPGSCWPPSGSAPRGGLLAAHLSHGEKRHLELAIALATDPTLLLLDEPTAGMSPEETDGTMRLIRALAAGRTVVLVEHTMRVVMRISDCVTVLHQGQILAEGSPDEIRANAVVQRTYLGAGR